MPEQIKGTNAWNILPDEYFVTTEGEIVNGPISGVREQLFPELGRITIQHGNRIYEVEGNSVAEVVRKKE